MSDEFKQGDIVKVLPSVISDYANFTGQCGTIISYSYHYYRVKFETGLVVLLVKHEFTRAYCDWGDGE